ncbi:MAG: hypothetical protein EU536_03680, partial [Promethearchaeota archaeon]
GAMKGVILKICPNARLIDLSHQIEKHDIREGGFYLMSVAGYYPKKSIHLVVIDPGVGSEREGIIIETENYFWVGPNNGVLSLAAEKDQIRKIVEISEGKYYLRPISQTFHGRDIFAPVAAHLAICRKIENFGQPINSLIRLKIPEINIKSDGIEAEIIHIDRFGNLITNISQKLFAENYKGQKNSVKLVVKQKNLEIPICSSYSQVMIGELLGIFGSYGFLEISRNQASAAEELGLQINDRLFIHK